MKITERMLIDSMEDIRYGLVKDRSLTNYEKFQELERRTKGLDARLRNGGKPPKRKQHRLVVLPSAPDCLSAAPVIALLMVLAFCLPWLFTTLVCELIAYLSSK